MSYLLKFIKEDLVWAEPKFTKFHKPFLAKNALLSACEILGFAHSLVGFYHLALLCRSYKRYEKSLKSLEMHLLQSFLSPSSPCIERTTREIRHRMLHSKNFQFYCSNLAAPPFAAVSALLTKFLLKALKKVICSPL